MRKLLSTALLLFGLNLIFAQDLSKSAMLDSALIILKTQYSKSWAISKHGSRIVMTKNDSIFVATSSTNYKPGKPFTDFVPVKYKYQLFIDFTESDLDFSHKMRSMINDSISRIKKSFEKKSYAKGEYYIHLEAMEQLEKIKLKEPVHLKNFDVKFSDNCAEDWIPYDWKDVQHLPFEPPTSFQRMIEGLKENIRAAFLDAQL